MVAPPNKDQRPSAADLGTEKNSSGGFASRMVKRLFGSQVYGASLRGPIPVKLAFEPQSLWPQPAQLAAEIGDGVYRLGGQVVQTGGKVPWSVSGTSTAWQRDLHGFSWLSAFQRSQRPDQHIFLERLVALWAEAYAGWDDVAWSADVLANRILAWLEAWPMISSEINDTHNRALLKSLAEGARHLMRSASSAESADHGFRMGAAIVFAGVCLFDNDRWIREGFQRLRESLELELLHDGCHASRNPETLLETSRTLLSLQHLLRDSGHPAPEFLQYAVDRAVTALKCFIMGDGKLAVFAGGSEGNREHLARAVELSDSRSQAPQTLSQGGYHRLEAGPLICLMDTGSGQDVGTHHPAHQSCLSFELSDGPDRLIVNCGTHPYGDAGWQRAMASPAAHSTVAIGEQTLEAENSANARPASATIRTRENDKWRAIEGHHDGYNEDHDIRHFRRLFLAQDGSEVRGEDTLVGPRGARGIGAPFAARFHLHPNASASVLQDGKSVLIRLNHGAGWRFVAAGASPELASSIYFGTGTERRTQQITLRGTINHETVIRWSLERL